MALTDFLVKRLDADLELQCAGRKFGDDFAQRFRQPVGNHLEMEEMAGPVALQKEFENRFADGDVQIERAVNELELLHAAVKQALQLSQKAGRGTCRTGMSSDDRQNSQVNGQPRDAST